MKLESLELGHVRLLDDSTDLWKRALSFLRTNKTLKSLLVVDVNWYVTESACLSAFRIDVVAMLQENASLKSLSVRKLEQNQSQGTYRARYRPPTQYEVQDSQSCSQWKSTVDRRRKQSNGLALREKICIGKSSRYLPGE